jgi:hypothetical protein
MASELSSIPGLTPKHAAMLTGTLQVSTARQLASADRRAIHFAMRRLRPAPTLEAISDWQDHARDLAATYVDSPVPSGQALPAGWEQAAAFVVSFETRQASTDKDHRLVVEQVEQAPPEPRQEWPAWTPDAAWTWMLERAEPTEGTNRHTTSKREHVGEETARSSRPRKGSASRQRAAKEPGPKSASAPGHVSPPENASVVENVPLPETGPARKSAPAPKKASKLPKDSVQESASLPESAADLSRIRRRIAVDTPELALEDGTVSRLEAGGRDVDVPPHAAIRVVPTCEHGMRLHVALRLRRVGAPSYAPIPPVVVMSGQTAEIGLRCLPAGEHTAVLTIWAPRGAAAAAVVSLPQLRVPE